MAKYRLQALLRVRLREKKKAELLLARRMLELREAREKLNVLKKELKEIHRKEKEKHQKMDAEMAGGGLIASGCFHVNFLRRLKEDAEAKTAEIEDQKKEIEECQEKVAKARKAYIEAVKALRMMEKHKTLWARKVALEMLRREEKVMDEVGQSVHTLRKWRGEKSEFQLE